jgi:hypothetical protein
MTIKLFELENGVIKATEHCYTIDWLHDIMTNYPDNYLKIYAYIFYMTCPNPELNPFFNMPEDDKEDLIIDSLKLEVSVDDELITRAIQKCTILYTSPTLRAYNGISKMLDKLSFYMETAPITAGRDGNINSLLAAAKNFQAIRESFKGVLKDLEAEQSKTSVRGGQNLGYDQL